MALTEAGWDEPVEAREAELLSGAVEIPATFDVAHFRAIGDYLHQDVDPEHGGLRNYDMARGQVVFAAAGEEITEYLELAAAVFAAEDWSNMSDERFARRAAETMMIVHQAQPYAVGTSAVERVLLKELAKANGRDANLDRVTRAQWQAVADLDAQRFDDPTPGATHLTELVREALPAQPAESEAAAGVRRSLGALAPPRPGRGSRTSTPPRRTGPEQDRGVER